MELRMESLLSFVKNRNTLTKTGSDALKFSERMVPVATLIGASDTNTEYWLDAGTVTVTGSVDVPVSSVKYMSTVTSVSFGFAIAINERALSVTSTRSRPVWRSRGARIPVSLSVIPSWRYSRIWRPFSFASGLFASADAHPVTWKGPAPGVRIEAP